MRYKEKYKKKYIKKRGGGGNTKKEKKEKTEIYVCICNIITFKIYLQREKE
jgi:CRISPR/Cas system-associated protein Cas7 (RAMP superfamily)